MPPTPDSSGKPRGSAPWRVLLLLPNLGLCFPHLYTHATPTLLGFPFFYWYQFVWVALTSGILSIYYLRLRKHR